MGLQNYVQTQMNDSSGLSAEFDGVAITDFTPYRSQITKYSYTLPAEPNVYTCLGQTGVTNTISPAYAGGWYAMIAPPAKGAHTLHFAGTSTGTMPALMLDVTYHLTVQ
jgi:hypothetical protein